MKKYFKKFSVMFVILLAIVGIITIKNGTAANAATADPAQTVASLSVNPSMKNVVVGEKQQLKVIATMGDWSTKDVTSGSDGTTYSSTNTSAITVDKNGLITVLPTAIEGKVVIIKASNGGKTAISIIIITSDSSPIISNISIDPEEVTLTPGEQRQLTVTATMSDEVTKDITSGSEGTTYTSSDDSIATVDENGFVTVIKEGQVTITAAIDNGLTATCIINVTNA